MACRALGVSTSWFYKWVGEDTSPRRARRRVLAALVRGRFHQRKGCAGSPGIHADLVEADLVEMGWAVSKNTVAVLMAEQNLVARRRRKRRCTTKQNASARKAPDLAGRRFSPPPETVVEAA